MKAPITTHVLDTANGNPAAGMTVLLERMGPDLQPSQLGTGVTDRDGRCNSLQSPGTPLEPGTYRLTFSTGEYFLKTHKQKCFFPIAQITFQVDENCGREHFHVPLLLSNYSFSTYRGS
ncbi:MAG: hypothetical protein SGCHY_001720 [Lobulomycetales sp.]